MSTRTNHVVLVVFLFIILLIGTIIKYTKKKRIIRYYPYDKSVCLYVYYEKDSSYKRNFEYFIENGINEYSDFVFIINGYCSVSVPKLKNVTVIRRENKGFDFGAYSDVLKEIPIDEYKYFIFINTSVRGPFLKPDSLPWQSYFIGMINEETKLVGTTINISTNDFDYLASKGFKKPYSHVQTQMFAMDRECLDFLIPRVFNVDWQSEVFHGAIEKGEVGMSTYVLNNGWNINCILPKYKDLDYREIKEDINTTSMGGDGNFRNRYFGSTFSPYDVIFIKTNRYLVSDPYLTLISNF